MRLFVFIYYLFYVLSGGFRHYSFDFIFSATLEGMLVLKTPAVVSVAEIILMLSAFAALFFPLKKQVHLVFFTFLFFMDLYFQNQVKFMSCFILPHFYPLFFFLFLHFKDKAQQRELVLYSAMLFVAVGYMASCVSKANSVWFNWSDTVIYSYVLEFYSGFSVPSLLSGKLVGFKNQLFWKLADYSVLTFQCSFVLVFFRKNYFYFITLFAVLFHIGIMLTLGIGVVFFVYILFYAFVFSATTNRFYLLPVNSDKLFSTIGFMLTSALLLLFIYSSFNVRFFNVFLPTPIFIFAEYFYTLICILIYGFSFYQWYRFKQQPIVTPIQA